MKLRSGKKLSDISKKWWYPYVVKQHKHQAYCYCVMWKNTAGDWLKNDPEEVILKSIKEQRATIDLSVERLHSSR